MKKLYLAWLGQKNCTTGQPHPKTGCMSKYGTLYLFSNKKARDEFCEQYSYIHNAYPVATNKKEAKSKYCAGETQQFFAETLKYAEYSDGLKIK